MAAVELEDMHGDPIHRIIVATAFAHDAVLLTADRPILSNGRVRCAARMHAGKAR